jgi:hypothetical protein
VVFTIFSLLQSCDGTGKKETAIADLSIAEENPAAALTVGWYLPVNYLQRLIGPDFKPSILKDDTLGLLKLVITKSDDSRMKGKESIGFQSATLLIEVDEPRGLFKSPPKDRDHSYVCPVIIVSGNIPMAQAYYDHGFVTEQSEVDLKLTKKNDRINVEATIRSGENNFTARCFFEDLPVDEESAVMVVNRNRPMYRYFYGTEKYNRYVNGKGRIDAEGITVVSSLGIQNMPYIFILDTDLSWGYNFD